MTVYNVEMDTAKWAEEKARLTPTDRRLALMRALIKLDQQGAYHILGELGRAEHAARIELRRDKNHRAAMAA